MKTFTPETLPKMLVVSVTAEDIAHGQIKDCRNCPLARALERTYPVAKDCWTIAGGAWLQRGDAVFRLSLPALQFAIAFDSGLDVAPATFHLRRPL